MSQPPPPAEPLITPSRVIAGICLIVPFVAMLWVNSFARTSPEFIGIPFFYWYQLAWVLGSTALTALAYALIRREERARRRTSAAAPADDAKGDLA
jgi:hypothetical protein